VSFDPHALKIYVDGSCTKNPGGSGGFAAWIEFPFDWNRDDELLDLIGYFETNSIRMELRAAIFAHKWVRDVGVELGVQRFQVVTDSKYVFENYNRAIAWSQSGWRTRHDRPIDNKDLWKEMLSIRRSLRVRVDVQWTKGKRSPILKAVDRSSKEASATPVRSDRGFRAGKIGRSRNSSGQTAKMFPAAGQPLVIRVYQTVPVRRQEQKVKFQTYSEQKKDFFDKFSVYAHAELANNLHRHHVYLVQMNDVPQYPRIEEILAELEEGELVPPIVGAK
jgi:ribonuclease HI